MSFLGDDVSAINDRRPTFLGRIASARAAVLSLLTGERRQFVATFLTTMCCFGFFFVQGIFVARMLGPAGRGEFGSALYFPRDILLYAGLLGAIEIVAGYAARAHKTDLGSTLVQETNRLRFSAFRLGLTTGLFTATVAAVVSIVVLLCVGKAYIIPFCLLICVFLPFEHVHLTVSAVDRGNRQFMRYNINRLLFAIAFPILILIAWQSEMASRLGISELFLACFLFVVARIIGLIPTMFGWNFREQLTNSFRGRKNEDLVPTTSNLLKEGKPYALSMILSEAFDRLDVFLIVALADMTTSGHYFVAVPAAALLIIAPNSLAIFTFNAGADKQFRPTMKLAVVAVLLTALLQLVATIVFALIIGFLIVSIFGKDFEGAIPFAMWLLPASAIKGFLQAADGYLKGRQKPQVGIWARGIGILVMLAFMGIFYPSLGVITIPMAACFAQAVCMVFILIGLFLDIHRRQISEPIEVSHEPG